MTDADARLDGFIDRFAPEVAATGRAAIERMSRRLPTAVRLVYDNYNALAVGFAPGERASEAIFSVAFYPRWVSFFFLQGAGLEDPAKVLEGKGSVVRRIVLGSADDLDRPEVADLIDRALAAAKVPLALAGDGRLVIKSVSAKQRPRRPLCGPGAGH